VFQDTIEMAKTQKLTQKHREAKENIVKKEVVLRLWVSGLKNNLFATLSLLAYAAERYNPEV
jgi:hypothetical protein